MYDGSGLSRRNRVATSTLLGLLQHAAGPEGEALRSLVTGMPVAGFTGSLTYRFAEGPPVARGLVRAKTGTLTGVHALAGFAVGRDGEPMVFVLGADKVAAPTPLRRAGGPRPRRRRPRGLPLLRRWLESSSRPWSSPTAAVSRARSGPMALWGFSSAARPSAGGGSLRHARSGGRGAAPYDVELAPAPPLGHATGRSPALHSRAPVRSLPARVGT